MKKLLIAAFAVSAVGANADILWDQADTALIQQYISTEFTDIPDQSTYLFDNINTGGATWNVTRVMIEGFTNDAAGFSSFHLRFSQNANFTAPGTVGLEFSTTDGTTYTSDDDLDFNLGAGMELAPGTWFVSAWVVSNFGTMGQWNWDATDVVTGGEAIAHNPGGGLLGVTDPQGISQITGGPQQDMVFRIEGAPVPEPGTFVAIGLGLAGLFVARRRK
jgi:hypothetical protein